MVWTTVSNKGNVFCYMSEWYCVSVNAISKENAVFKGFSPIIAQSRDRKRDFFTPLDRAQQGEENGISLSRIACTMAQIRGGCRICTPPPSLYAFAWPKLNCIRASVNSAPFTMLSRVNEIGIWEHRARLAYVPNISLTVSGWVCFDNFVALYHQAGQLWASCIVLVSECEFEVCSV